MNKAINWVYLGVFIDISSKLKNLKALDEYNITIPENWKRFNHHMTIAFNNGSKLSNELYAFYRDMMGNKAILTIDGIGVSDEAIAVRVRWVGPMANKIAHVTIATPPNGKPVNSNKITKWFDIQPYKISGKFEQFAK
jgi:hypothetical protein